MSFSRKPMNGKDSSEAFPRMGNGKTPPQSARSNSLYAVLDVAHTATTEEITAAYRRLALAYHPDRPNGSHEAFQEIQRAYEVLGSTETRTKYDALRRGKLALRGFRRPPPLESVLQPVYALLVDGAFYEFEAAPSKLKCSFHYGDGIELKGDRGSFIGLAGDGFIYWSINGRGFASKLCQLGGSFALSSVRLTYRSNMGLRKTPLQRSSLEPSHKGRAGSSSCSHQASDGGAGGERHSTNTNSTNGVDVANLFKARSIKEALLKKERGRNRRNWSETIGREEKEERSDLEHNLWDQLNSLHRMTKTALCCVLRGTAVPPEVLRWMVFSSGEEVVQGFSNDSATSPAVESVSQATSPESFYPLQSSCRGNVKNLHENGDDKELLHHIGRGRASPSRSESGSAHSVSSSALPQRVTTASVGPSERDSCCAHSAAAPPPMSSATHRPDCDTAVTAEDSTAKGLGVTEALASRSLSPRCSAFSLMESGKDAEPHPTDGPPVPSTFLSSSAISDPPSRSSVEEVPLMGCANTIHVDFDESHTQKKRDDCVSSSLHASQRLGNDVPREASVVAQRGAPMRSTSLVSAFCHEDPEHQGFSGYVPVVATTSPSSIAQRDFPTETPVEDLNGGCVASMRQPLASILQGTSTENTRNSRPAVSQGKELGRHLSTRAGPRYMSATVAQSHRARLLPIEASNPATHRFTPSHGATHRYSGSTGDQLFEEERAFMESFAKTKRIV